MTVANLAIVREVAEDLGLKPQFTIIGMRDSGAAYVSTDEAGMFPVDARSLVRPSGCWKVIGEQDLVLDIGAGDSFADIYGAKRFAYMWLTKVIAITRRIPLLLSPQTIGPFSRAPYTYMARFALERARAVVARDTVSFDFLRKLAPAAKAVLSVDVAFALPFHKAKAHAAGRVAVGVNVSGLLFGEATSGSNRFGLQIDYADLMRRFIGRLCDMDGVDVYLLTHANGSDGDADDDARAVDQLAEEFPSAVRIGDFSSPSAAKSYISGLDFLVAGRMHACIAAYSSGTPVVPIAYSRKFSGLFGMLGYRWLVPVQGMTTSEALDYLLDCLARREELCGDSARGMALVGTQLDAYRAELRCLMTETV